MPFLKLQPYSCGCTILTDVSPAIRYGPLKLNFGREDHDEGTVLLHGGLPFPLSWDDALQLQHNLIKREDASDHLDVSRLGVLLP
jgi:hypothetical protein